MGTILGQLFQRSDDLLDYDIRNDEGKAVLGDLKSGYLNSFAAFLHKTLSPSQKQQFIKSQTLREIYQVYSDDVIKGQDLFQQQVERFDGINKKLIDLYEHHLENLEKQIEPSQKKLIAHLKPLTEILYWRRKPQK